MSSAEPTVPVLSPPVRLSPIARAVRVFARPATAWDDLVERGQWLPPLLASLVLWAGLQALCFDHVTVPMMQDAWNDAVSAGRMEQAQMDKMMAFFSGPTARWIVVG